VEQLRDVLLFLFENEEWNSEILYTHVPRAFENDLVAEGTARSVLLEAISRALFQHFQS
jgi:hypothetical protein